MISKKILKVSGFITLIIISLSAYKRPALGAVINEGIVNLKPTYIDDLDNILYPSTSAYYTYDGIQGVGSFSITKPTIVKAYFNWDITTNKNVTGSAWFSRDSDGMDIIGEVARLKNIGDSTIVFLDPGVYYINFLFNIKDNYISSWNKVGVALLAEDINSNESIYASSYYSPNILVPGKAIRGLLSTSSPIDYYKLVIKELSKVTITYNFEQTGNMSVSKGVCTLYDELNQKIASGDFSTRGVESNKLTKMLEPGTYYVAMSGAVCATSILAEVISYDVKIKVSHKDWTNENIKVSVIYDFDETEILYVNEYVSNANINSNLIWNTRMENCKMVTNKEFEITANGTYTIRIRDDKNYYVLARVTVDNIDKTLPTVTGVSDNKTYKQDVTIKFYDNESGIKKGYLNGYGIKSGTKISENGKYTLEVYDKAFNVNTITFTIKK